jgi:2,5-diamino-6-(ribosylamino)-4(3H)-pyrimidinone 5'-phosphate reductase
MSADGKIAGVERTQVRISNEEDMLRAKELRRRYNAILAGVGTITADDPHLTIKGASAEENPVRIIIDPKGRTPKDAQAVDDRATTLILTEDGCTEEWKNAYIIECGKPFDLTAAMRHLADWGIESMLVEGGGRTIASFFEKNIVDRYTVFIGAMIIGGKDAPTPADGNGWVAENGLKMRLKNAEILGDGVLLTYEAIR